MRGKAISLLATGGALGIAAVVTASLAAPRFADLPRKVAQTSVDVELVLAVDISYSMDLDELALQREGYTQALTSPEFLNAVKQGMHGKIAVTYFEWAGAADQKEVMGWRI
ncbi:MAG TPA: DUF1194 domain-containing protein, partial [Xanthobacteraceae bacterium]|nr:DUF1194 domain-containing protein [Xanthobacteraceae bacterium]